MAQTWGRGRPKLTPEDWDSIVELYKRGYSTVELARMYNVTPQAIYVYLKVRGIARSRKEAQVLRAKKVLPTVQ
jgi:transposase-like protein